MNPLRQSRWVTALVTAAALVTTTALAACSGTSSDSTSAAVTSQPAASFTAHPATGTPISIGLINNEGGQAISQPENRETAEAAAKYANDHLGGIGGHPIKLVICKNAEEPTSARDCANRMVEAKVSAVVVTSTGLGDILVPIITGAGIPYVSAAGQSREELTNSLTFMWSGGFPASLDSMAADAQSKNITTVSAFTIDVPAAVNGLRSFGAASFASRGIDLNVVAIPPGTPDATPQVSAGLDNSPGAVIVVGEANLCTAALKSLGTLGYSGVTMGIQGCATPAVVRAVGASINGLRVYTAASTVGDNPEALLYRSVVAKYSPDTDITGYAYVGYQGMLGLVRATAAINPAETSPQAIAAAIRAAREVVLPAGDGLTFTCNGAANPTLKSVCGKGSVVATLENGQLTDAEVHGN
ncbi:MAG: ABC transporter substrate-binding protein [Gordonia sp. (in: high G+C Gram-positive bacteria)]